MKIAVFHNLSSGGAKGALYGFIKYLTKSGHLVDVFVPSTDNNQEVFKNTISSNLMKTASDLKLLRQDVFSLSFNDKAFDVAFSQGFFEHFSDEDIVQLVKEQLRVANKVIFYVPSFWFPSRDFGNERLLRMEEWVNILNKDFRISKSFHYRFNRKLKYFLKHKPMHICIVIEEV